MRVFVAAAVVMVAAFLIYAGIDGSGGDARADHAGPVSHAMVIDMDPSQSPANTGTSLGSIETCARINENNTLDGNEDAVDTLNIDVIVDTIPASNPAIATTFRLLFPAPNQMTVIQDAIPYAVANAWTIFDVSDSIQSDGDYLHSVADFQPAGTSGSGAISRLNIETEGTASQGVFPLVLSEPAHIDTGNNARTPANAFDSNGDTFPDVQGATVAINTVCPDAPPTASPSPTPTPTPTPGPSETATPTPTPTSTGTVTPSPTNGSTPGPTATPTLGPTGTPPPEPKPGDIDCDDDQDAADALAILRFVGGFSDELVACAQPASAPSGESKHGDMDCDDDVDAVDALVILRFVVGFLDELVAC